MPSEHDIAFPRLNRSQIDALRPWGRVRPIAPGDLLFQEGDRGFSFYVVLDGAVEIVEQSRGTSREVTVHEPGEFTGDVDTLSGRASLVTGRATARGEVLELTAAALRQAVDALPEIGETVLKAFLTRRTLLLSDGFEGIKIIGSRFSPDAHRLRDFASRNAIPFTWIDLESDEQAETLLRQFGVPPSATPVVIRGKSILVATGVEYRRLDVPRLSEFEGAGVYYAATDTETKLCRNEEVLVVGRSNSAGQAIVALSRHARRVHVITRGRDLGKSMSRYLVDRVEQVANVQIHRGAVVTALEGDGHLEAVHVRDDAGGEMRIDTPALFLFIGADPHTEWLSGCVQLDKKGFVLTGAAVPLDAVRGALWRAQARTPFFLETSIPGVFAAG